MPIRRRSSGASRRLVNPKYENRGQSGKVEDIEIVGVIRNERVTDLESATPEVAYVSLLQAPRREIKLLVRTHGDPASVMPAIRDRRCRSSIRICRWATCGRWRRSSS